MMRKKSNTSITWENLAVKLNLVQFVFLSRILDGQTINRGDIRDEVVNWKCTAIFEVDRWSFIDILSGHYLLIAML